MSKNQPATAEYCDQWIIILDQCYQVSCELYTAEHPPADIKSCF